MGRVGPHRKLGTSLQTAGWPLGSQGGLLPGSGLQGRLAGGLGLFACRRVCSQTPGSGRRSQERGDGLQVGPWLPLSPQINLSLVYLHSRTQADSEGAGPRVTPGRPGGRVYVTLPGGMEFGVWGRAAWRPGRGLVSSLFHPSLSLSEELGLVKQSIVM